MNQTSLSVAEVGKTSALLQTGAGNTQSSGEASESEGFLSVLSSVFGGSETEGGEEVSAEGAEVSEAELSKSEVKAESVDELLELEGGEEGEKLEGESVEGEDAELVAKTSGESAETKKSGAEVSAEKKPVDPEVTKAMSEGSALLERLDESSQALQTEKPSQTEVSGKALPQSESKLAETSGQEAKQTTVEKLIESDPLLSKYIKAVEQETPEESDLSPEELKAAQAEKIDNLKAVFQSAIEDGKAIEGEVPEQEAAQQLNKELSSLKVAKVLEENPELKVADLSESEIAALKQLQADQIKNEGEQPPNSKLVWDTAKTATAVGVGAALATAAQDSPSVQSADALAAGQVMQEAVQINEAVDPQMLTEEELAAMAQINWGAGTAENAVKVAPEMVKAAQPQVNHLQNQQLHQQLQQAQAQALSQGAERAAVQNNLQHVSPELSAAAMQNNAMAQTVLQQSQSAPLAGKAAVDASALALGAAGGLAAAKGSSDKDKDLSQQLAGLTSQQGVHQAQVRSEVQQAIQQSPLQLATKEAGAEQLAERVQIMLSKNLKNVDIRLDPPELGRMQIRMSMNGDMASVQFTVSNQQAREMIEHAMPRLREMLSQQGVQLGDSSVHQQNSGQQQKQYAMGNGSSGNGGSDGLTGGDEANLDESINLDVNIAAKDDGISYYA
ncbi:flagellar hook-length control protein FliK [Vibrio sp. JC009]|uniref:flagellar hook-length control protein FliK n=1 Tax=Vibrio sp. JC009 TaxID=2912314 RepID=UPI0023B1080C|nr:flagellar hook-length control protein FliK [Vibrio sp. JC009]WED21059.1 flagellar hook-length control protein FliK [Vibrio sp. JC009]